MKHLLLLSLLLVAATLTPARADSPDAILKDYRKQAAPAVERINQSLEKAATPLITKLISSGDTAGAKELTGQLKNKLAGEPVAAPHASATLLFAQYDQARAKALEPVQKAAFARIDSILKTAGGARLETMAELGNVRDEIQAGKAQSASEWVGAWGFHRSKDEPAESMVVFNEDGTAVFTGGKSGRKFMGTWERVNAHSIKAAFSNDKWIVTAKKSGVEVQGEAFSDTRFLIPSK